MKVAIVGSRNFSDLSKVKQYVGTLPPNSVIVSGGARGPDKAAELAALELGMEIEIYLPDWEAYGKSAGMVRNQQIVDHADMLVAFWDGKSRGTRNSIQRALTADNISRIEIYKDA